MTMSLLFFSSFDCSGRKFTVLRETFITTATTTNRRVRQHAARSTVSRRRARRDDTSRQLVHVSIGDDRSCLARLRVRTTTFVHLKRSIEIQRISSMHCLDVSLQISSLSSVDVSNQSDSDVFATARSLSASCRLVSFSHVVSSCDAHSNTDEHSRADADGTSSHRQCQRSVRVRWQSQSVLSGLYNSDNELIELRHVIVERKFEQRHKQQR
jgi:hypothetical protein